MSGVAVLLRTRRREQARPWGVRKTKAVQAADLRRAAAALAKYADHPEMADQALWLLDHADELEVSPRAGWYPRRPGRSR